jgi:hypothetical protein
MDLQEYHKKVDADNHSHIPAEEIHKFFGPESIFQPLKGQVLSTLPV